MDEKYLEQTKNAIEEDDEAEDDDEEEELIQFQRQVNRQMELNVSNDELEQSMFDDDDGIGDQETLFCKSYESEEEDFEEQNDEEEI